MLDGNCRQLRRSDEGEVSGVEAEDHPPATVVRQLHILEGTVHQSPRLEVWRLLANPRCHASRLLSFLLPAVLRDRGPAPIMNYELMTIKTLVLSRYPVNGEADDGSGADRSPLWSG